jgi:hypothetical protein
VVSLGKLTAGHEEYYERAVAGGAEDYAMRGEAAGEWTGSGAQALGLEGTAPGGQLRALLEGRDAATGGMLRSRAVQVTGWDVTYSPPKSVSVLHAAGDPRITAIPSYSSVRRFADGISFENSNAEPQAPLTTGTDSARQRAQSTDLRSLGGENPANGGISHQNRRAVPDPSS